MSYLSVNLHRGNSAAFANPGVVTYRVLRKPVRFVRPLIQCAEQLLVIVFDAAAAAAEGAGRVSSHLSAAHLWAGSDAGHHWPDLLQMALLLQQQHSVAKTLGS